MKGLVRILWVLAIASGLAGCGGGGGDAAAAVTPPAADAAPVVAVFELDASSWDESVWL
jgi:hypothetical protein